MQGIFPHVNYKSSNLCITISMESIYASNTRHHWFLGNQLRQTICELLHLVL